MAELFCSLCGTANREDAAFCKACGAQLQTYYNNAIPAQPPVYGAPAGGVPGQLADNVPTAPYYAPAQEQTAENVPTGPYYAPAPEQIADSVPTVPYYAPASAPEAGNKPKGKKKGKKIVAVVLAISLLLGGGGIALWSVLHNKKDADPIGEISYSAPEEAHFVIKDGIGYVDNELAVVAEKDVSHKQMEKLAKKYGAEVVGCIEKTGDYQWRLEDVPSRKELETLAAQVREEPKVRYVSLNFCGIANDDSVSANINTGSNEKWQEELGTTDRASGVSWGAKAVLAPAAWSLADRNKNKITPVNVGVIDSGFDENHEDLPITQTFYNGGNGEHGTHVTGTFAANGMNDIGICGIYPYASEAQLYCADWTNSKKYAENLQNLIYEKVCFAELILRNVKVINCSYGFSKCALKYDYFLNELHDRERADSCKNDMRFYANSIADFLDRLISLGYDFLIVASAGNDSNGEHKITIDDTKITHKTKDIDTTNNSHFAAISREDYPEVYDRILIVGAFDRFFRRCFFSNNGSRVDIMAPGWEIYSTVPGNRYENYQNALEAWAGTSMAAPHAAGAAALAWSANNKLTGPMIKKFIIKFKNEGYTEFNVLNAYRVLQAALGVKDSDQLTDPAADPSLGAVYGFVVDIDTLTVNEKGIRTGAVPDANVVCTNLADGGESYTSATDFTGHFECYLPAGEYSVSVTADGYFDCTWPETVTVTAENVTYLSDWIKLTAKATQNDLNEFERIFNSLPYSGSWAYNNSVAFTDLPLSKLIDDYVIGGFSLQGLLSYYAFDRENQGDDYGAFYEWMYANLPENAPSDEEIWFRAPDGAKEWVAWIVENVFGKTMDETASGEYFRYENGALMLLRLPAGTGDFPLLEQNLNARTTDEGAYELTVTQTRDTGNGSKRKDTYVFSAALRYDADKQLRYWRIGSVTETSEEVTSAPPAEDTGYRVPVRIRYEGNGEAVPAGGEVTLNWSDSGVRILDKAGLETEIRFDSAGTLQGGTKDMVEFTANLYFTYENGMLRKAAVNDNDNGATYGVDLQTLTFSEAGERAEFRTGDGTNSYPVMGWTYDGQPVDFLHTCYTQHSRAAYTWDSPDGRRASMRITEALYETQSFPGAITLTYDYDEEGDLKEIRTKTPAARADGAALTFTVTFTDTTVVYNDSDGVKRVVVYTYAPATEAQYRAYLEMTRCSGDPLPGKTYIPGGLPGFSHVSMILP